MWTISGINCLFKINALCQSANPCHSKYLPPPPPYCWRNLECAKSFPQKKMDALKIKIHRKCNSKLVKHSPNIDILSSSCSSSIGQIGIRNIHWLVKFSQNRTEHWTGLFLLPAERARSFSSICRTHPPSLSRQSVISQTKIKCKQIPLDGVVQKKVFVVADSDGQIINI